MVFPNQMRLYKAYTGFLLILLCIFCFIIIENTFKKTRDFSFIILPDTQRYSQKYPEILLSQMDWIKDNYSKMNTKAVITLGDIVQSHDNKEIEWKRASKAYEILDNIPVPYNVLPGNHDITKDGATKLFNKYFPPSRFKNKTWYGGNHDGTNRNNYITVNTGSADFILVSLEYCPPDEAVLWARDIFEQHPKKIGLLATHAYLNEDGVQSKECKRLHRLGNNAGYDIWEKVIKPSENVQIVMNGHFHHEQGGSYLTSKVGDRTIHQIMSNYQDFEKGGNGFLRIFDFTVEDETVTVRAYSPFINEFLEDDVNNFTFTLKNLYN